MVWGAEGSVHNWVWPPQSEIGSRGDVVAEVTSYTCDSALVSLIPCGTRAKIMGAIKVPPDCNCVSIFDATLLDKVPFLVFVVDNASDVLYHKKGNRDDLFNIIELCSGIGIGAFGFKEAGMRVVEKSILAKIPAPGMEFDSTGEQEARLIALEHQVHALAAGQQQLDQKLDDSVARNDTQYQALHTANGIPWPPNASAVLLLDAADWSLAFQEAPHWMTVLPRPCSLQGWWPLCNPLLPGLVLLDRFGSALSWALGCLWLRSSAFACLRWNFSWCCPSAEACLDCLPLEVWGWQHSQFPSFAWLLCLGASFDLVHRPLALSGSHAACVSACSSRLLGVVPLPLGCGWGFHGRTWVPYWGGQPERPEQQSFWFCWFFSGHLDFVRNPSHERRHCHVPVQLAPGQNPLQVLHPWMPCGSALFSFWHRAMVRCWCSDFIPSPQAPALLASCCLQLGPTHVNGREFCNGLVLVSSLVTSTMTLTVWIPSPHLSAWGSVTSKTSMLSVLANFLLPLAVGKRGGIISFSHAEWPGCLFLAKWMMSLFPTIPTSLATSRALWICLIGLSGLSLTQWTGKLPQISNLSLTTCSCLIVTWTKIMKPFGERLKLTTTMPAGRNASPLSEPCKAVGSNASRNCATACWPPPRLVAQVTDSPPSLALVFSTPNGSSSCEGSNRFCG